MDYKILDREFKELQRSPVDQYVRDADELAGKCGSKQIKWTLRSNILNRDESYVCGKRGDFTRTKACLQWLAKGEEIKANLKKETEKKPVDRPNSEEFCN